ncbi:hypothetical protein [Nitrobacter vulgaris]|uniref:Sulfur globule protein n=1 Tax=Nitrobacter vulgaris TaxID=29421 RepID=A0A1V4HZK9_NITVU|nr:hypothetical protein [Nitrobacter vulgaris]OPH83305.1 hypothetical protein B2M20_07670 [Nitrobacter vulgaris]
MTYRKLGALATVGAIALAFATNEAIAQAGGAGVVAAPQAGATVRGAHAFNRGVDGYFWPGYGYDYGAYVPAAGPITAPFAGPAEVRYTTTFDVPWNWAHRFPPNVIPSDRPYVPGCGEESVGVGGGKTVNVMRCY